MTTDPANDEVIILVLSLSIAGWFWGRWYRKALGINAITPVPQRQWLYRTPIACLVLVLLVLTQWADLQVRHSGFYLALFLAIAGVGLQGINGTASFLGLGAIANGIERKNSAVIWAICGTWIGATACIAGSNIGTGPTIYTTIESLLLSVGSLIGLWLLYAGLTGNAAAIVVDRDVASGIRLAGLLIAGGLILGRAVAGDWVSTAATIADFVQSAWITLPLLGVASVIERQMQLQKRQPFPAIRAAGWYPAIGYVISALLWLLNSVRWR